MNCGAEARVPRMKEIHDGLSKGENRVFLSSAVLLPSKHITNPLNHLWQTTRPPGDKVILLLKSALLDRSNWQACLRLRGAKQTCCSRIQSNSALCLPCRAGSEPIYLQHTVAAAVMTLIRSLVGGANAMNADKPTSFLVTVADGQYKIFACCVLDHHRDFNNSIIKSPG